MSGVYCCPYCLKAQGTPELLTELPEDWICTCFLVHGQYLAVEVNGEEVGTILVTSDVIKQMQTNALATPS